MSQDQHERHLSPELMQSFLDGDASPQDALRVQEHTSACARCRSELDAWKTLFSGLGELDQVAPGPGFRERVLGSLPSTPIQQSLGVRVLLGLGRALGLLAPAPPAWLRGGHPGADAFQDFLEGQLPQQAALALEGHLHACRGCRQEVESWRAMLVGIATLPTYAPSAEFPEKVMAHVRVQLAAATARPSKRETLQRFWESVSPRTRKRVAALAGAGVTPAVTLGLMAYAIFSHPLATLGNLFSFVWLEGSGRLGVASSGVLSRASESSTLTPVFQMLELILASPGGVALAVSGVAGLTLSAAWVFYRNVLVPQPAERRRAR